VSASVLLSAATWFSGTAAISALRQLWALDAAQAAWLTGAVQLGFVTGTFMLAALNVSDLFNPRSVFLVSSLCGAVFNAAFAWSSESLPSALFFRFLTGLSLAGVYPVAMKVVASWFRTGLGWRLGVMVGALGLGTASPYLIQAIGGGLPWRTLASTASASAVAGGLLLRFGLGDGPFLPARARFEPRAGLRLFARPGYRYTALAYFGHMWELYALWSLVPFYLAARFAHEPPLAAHTIPLLAFATVAAGVVGCVGGGWISRRAGERRVALVSLLVSGTLSLLSGFVFGLPFWPLTACLLVWGVFVVADSAQFSALALRHAPKEYSGTALTLQNGMGFAVTVVSLQVIPRVAAHVGWRWAFVPLALGPAFGVWALMRLGRLRLDE
jgi:MFS family permease